MVWGAFEPKNWEEEDVDIQVTHCDAIVSLGLVCVELYSGNVGFIACCVGHEIVGKAVRVGNNVKGIQVGDRVGLGAQAYSCMKSDCPECSSGRLDYCAHSRALTYGAVYPDGKGMSYGGHSDYDGTNSNFVIKIRDRVSSEAAAPMLCAGVTMFAPLRRYGCGPGKTVGIIGVGGLGHFGIRFAKGLGADKVVGISRRSDKREDALKLGADQYIATSKDDVWAKANARSLDIIICTVCSARMPLAEYMSLLKVGGMFVRVGLPDDGNLPPISAWTFFDQVDIAGTFVGSPDGIREMFTVAAEKQIKPWIETRPMTEANQAVLDFEEGKPRYRYDLVNEKHL